MLQLNQFWRISSIVFSVLLLNQRVFLDDFRLNSLCCFCYWWFCMNSLIFALYINNTSVVIRTVIQMRGSANINEILVFSLTLLSSIVLLTKFWLSFRVVLQNPQLLLSNFWRTVKGVWSFVLIQCGTTIMGKISCQFLAVFERHKRCKRVTTNYFVEVEMSWWHDVYLICRF